MIDIRNIRWTDQYVFDILILQITTATANGTLSVRRFLRTPPSDLREGHDFFVPEERNLPMRTTERTNRIAIARPTAAGRTNVLWAMLVSVYRAIRNRVEFNRLQDLDDHQLLDIGLTRSDVRQAATSTFFEDPFLELRTTARNRARRMERTR